MRSKSLNLDSSYNDIGKQNKTLDFIGFYKSAAETSKFLGEVQTKTGNYSETPECDPTTSKRGRSLHKKKKRMEVAGDLSSVSIVDPSKNSSLMGDSPIHDTESTSTPKTHAEKLSVKSIMKSVPGSNDEVINEDTKTTFKSKKRNKSVSFMLDSKEQVVIKKSKSEESLVTEVNKVKPNKDKRNKTKIFRREKHYEKENKADGENKATDIPPKGKKHKSEKININNEGNLESKSESNTITEKPKHKKKKLKKEDSEVLNADINDITEQNTETSSKKIKKKRLTKQLSNDEPLAKLTKIEIKPDMVVDDLENLSIGDNAHTLTSLIDQMTVVDKTKHKKSKSKRKDKNLVKNADKSNESPDIVTNGIDTEKVKWKKRKWNKDKKGIVDIEHYLETTVIVENLPISIMLTYKKLLAEHFSKFGLIKKIGVAEVYPAAVSTNVFTTTINFYSDGGATNALQLDKTIFEGNTISVKRPLPPHQTTLVVRSFGDLSDQNISTLFSSAGRIRKIRHVIKGRKTKSTAFVEFDSPETVERAIEMATDGKVGGKKVSAKRFEYRHKGEKKAKIDGGNVAGGESDASS